MDIKEKTNNLKSKRTNALNQKLSLLTSQSEAIEEDNFNNLYLWDDETNIGIQQLIKLYYQEKGKETGRTWSSPSLTNYTETYWEGLLEDSITSSGDGSNGFYPDSNSDGIANDEINTSTPYLNDNGDNGETSNGLFQDTQNVITSIGIAATTVGPYSGSGTLSEGLSNVYSDVDKVGTNLRGRRTRDTSPATEDTVGGTYTIGDEDIDTPNFFGDTTDSNGYGGNEKTNLLNYISTLITELEDYRDNIIIPLRDEVTKVFDGTNTLFTDMIGDLEDDTATLNSLISNLNNYLGTNTDTVTDGTLYGYYNFFNSAVGDEANFDTYLNELGTLSNNIETLITNRTTGLINTYVGDTYTDKMKKWRFFWIKERINKPSGSLITVNSITNSLSSSNDNIDDANATLFTVFGDTVSDKAQYIPTPILYAAYEDNLFNDDGTLNTRRATLVYQGQQHATKYEIFKRSLDEVTVDNSQWLATEYDTETDLNTEGRVKTQYTDSGSDFYTGLRLAYRVRIVDESNDSFTSGSLQSDLYDESVEYSFSSITDGIVDIGEHQVKVGQYIALKNTSESDGFYLVTAATETKLALYPQFNEDAGNLYIAHGILFILQEQPTGNPLLPSGEVVDEDDYSFVPHNKLGGLQGGTENERYHLTKSAFDKIAGISSTQGHHVKTAVSATVSTDIDQVNMNDVIGSDWFVAVEKSDDFSIASSRKVMSLINDSSFNYTEYASLDLNGGNSFEIGMATVDNILQLNFTNNESYTVYVYLTRYDVGRS